MNRLIYDNHYYNFDDKIKQIVSVIPVSESVNVAWVRQPRHVIVLLDIREPVHTHTKRRRRPASTDAHAFLLL